MNTLSLDEQEQALTVGIQDAIEREDLPVLAALIEQRKYLPLLRARRTKQVLDARLAQITTLANQWRQKQANVRTALQHPGNAKKAADESESVDGVRQRFLHFRATRG